MSDIVGSREAGSTVDRTRPQASSAWLAGLREWLWPLLLGLFLMLLGIVLISSVIALWPAVLEATQSTSTAPETITWFGYEYALTPDAALLLLVVLVSALGSFVHAATSFSDYMGNRKLRKSWIWWYVLRVFVGSGLALLFYFAIRGGFFAADTPSADINPYGIAAIAGLVGLFSKQATDKLREIFDTAFHVRPGAGDDARRDSITNPRPMLRGTEPAELTAGGDLVVDLDGEGFMPDSTVQVRRVGAADAEAIAREMTYVGPTRLRVTLRPEDIALAGVLELAVVNPEPGGGVSQALNVTIGDGGRADPED